jgi:SAM-dependent methyltransferase
VVHLEAEYQRTPYSPEIAEWLRARARRDLEVNRRRLRRYGVRRGARLLEIGSFVGAFLDFARDADADVVGVDLNGALCRCCRRRGHDVREGAFSAEDFPEHVFDGVWILNCFEAFSDLQENLRQVRRVLRPSGDLVIRTPNAAFVELAHRDTTPEWLRQVADHNALLGVPYRRCLSMPALAMVLIDACFEVHECRGRSFSSHAQQSTMAWDAARSVPNAAGPAHRTPNVPVQPWVEISARRLP